MADMQPILDALAETGNLTKACKDCGVTKSTFLRWVGLSQENADQYTCAREAGLDAEADRAISEALTAEDAGLGRLALDARKWYLSKLMPKKYGDKTLVGSDPENPLPQGFQVNLVRAKDAT